ncbi:MAG: 4Fe-4S binding protein [candidate division KSB1 bacterium]|nr:4Fe-4S binding protein [candidate division KSB1 bacterium]MDZ7295266.1 4Fe-4S binding protein [candidate division KSB1 bacterium]MDZ7338881.1 4Fe-4S binding protein [candidate division KSB1 bacterium]MDZ7378653.1 4Fe-4S binding protein [candidate division KSB1 bacterium]MDZ7385149.1 4Fe-4S binding protein [candidate division KSB1 bacterium]
MKQKTLLLKDDLCDLCGTCVAVCPVDALELSELRLLIDGKRCTLCMNCVHACPFACLEVRDEVPV